MESSNTVSVVYNTLVGVLKLEATSEGICSVKWLSTKQEETPRGQFTTKKRNDSCEETLNQKEDSVMSCSKANEHLKTCKAWLDAYFDGSLLKRHPPLPRPPLVLPMKGKCESDDIKNCNSHCFMWWVNIYMLRCNRNYVQFTCVNIYRNIFQHCLGNSDKHWCWRDSELQRASQAIWQSQCSSCCGSSCKEALHTDTSALS